MNSKAVGRKIKELRISHKMTQQQLADELFVTNKTVSKWENGRGLPEIGILQALASLFEVTVDDIISNNDLMPDEKDSINGERQRVKPNSIKLVIILFATLLIIVFGIYNIIWFKYIGNTFTPLTSNRTWTVEALKYRDSLDSSDNERTWIGYEHRNNENNFSVRVVKPPYLRFGGEVSVKTTALPDEFGFFAEFRISYAGKTGGMPRVYTLDLHDWNDAFRPPLSFSVDKNGQLLERSPDVSIEYYEKWLSIYETNYDEIMKMIEYFKTFFKEISFE